MPLDLPPDAGRVWLPPRPAIHRLAEHALLKPGAFRPCTRAERRAILADLVRSGRMTPAEAKQAMLLVPAVGWASGAASNPYALINATAANGTTGAIDTTGADLLVAVNGSQNNGTPSDNKGNTWTALTARHPSNGYGRMFYCRGGTVGAGHTFTSGGSYSSVAVAAFSGASASPFDQENGDTTNSATSLSTGSITPSSNNQLIIAGLMNGSTTSAHAIDSGFTIAAARPGVSGAYFGAIIAYLFQGTAASVNPEWTWTTTTNGAAMVGSFKSA